MSLASLFFIALFVIIGILLFKLIHKMASFIVTMLLIGCIFMGAFVYMDYRNIQTGNFETIFLFTSGGKLTYAAQARGFEFGTAGELARVDRMRLEALLNNSDLTALLGDNQKLVLVYEVPYKMERSALIDYFRNDTLQKLNAGMRDGNIIIYPETLYFRFIRKVPAVMVGRVS
jgi:hypothetical protein